MSEELIRCPTCNIVKGSKITDEKSPMLELDSHEPKVYYCKICGWIYQFDTSDNNEGLEGIVNINETLLFPKLRSIVFGLDTRLHKAVSDILDEVRTDEYLYDKNRKLCAVNENIIISNTELKSIKKNIANEVFKVLNILYDEENKDVIPGFITKNDIRHAKETVNINIDREII